MGRNPNSRFFFPIDYRRFKMGETCHGNLHIRQCLSFVKHEQLPNAAGYVISWLIYISIHISYDLTHTMYYSKRYYSILTSFVLSCFSYSLRSTNVFDLWYLVTIFFYLRKRFYTIESNFLGIFIFTGSVFRYSSIAISAFAIKS